MRISLDKIEEIRSDPEAYRQAVEAGEKGFARPGRHAIMQNALQKWHRGELTVEQARAEMISKCQKRFEAKPGLSTVVRRFDQYVENYQVMETETPLAPIRVSVQLPSGVDPRFRVTGTVRRLDRHSDGTYTAWLFEKTRANWQGELRLPLILNATAAKLNVNIEDLKIGVYCFSDDSAQTFSFTEAQVTNARKELGALLVNLWSLVQEEPLPVQIAFDL